MSIKLPLAAFYAGALGNTVEPYPYQRALAENGGYDVLIAPTGLGKTAAVTLAWAWQRCSNPEQTPRRLVWCQPMRTLVDQTAEQTRKWMERLEPHFRAAEQPQPEVYTLMGGAADASWRVHPELPAIIVGTQDMLLSRALMRGYGMSRFGWPIDFGLLHTDTLWVFDEVQLMGSGLATSAQLEAFRRMWTGTTEGETPTRSLWVSATLQAEWLRTVDFRKAPLKVLRWDVGGVAEPETLTHRLDATKRLRRADTRLSTADEKNQYSSYATVLATEVLQAHRAGHRTLAILNRVRRAQAVYEALLQLGRTRDDLVLVHSRFRSRERAEAQQALEIATPFDQIVVTTQAAEAGLDISSAALFTELAPWSSLVQRFGRCNRAGEIDAVGGAEIRWIDLDTEPAVCAPYDAEDLVSARSVVQQLDSAAPRRLPAATDGPKAKHLLRRKDFEELFDTDPDLSGYDLDISPYIRDADDTDLQLFWREGLDPDPGSAEPLRRIEEVPAPDRSELCAAPIGQVRTWLGRRSTRPLAAYVEDPNAREKGWLRLDRAPIRVRPGLVIMLDSRAGGYDPRLGLKLEAKGPVPPLVATSITAQVEEISPGAQTDSDPLSTARTCDVALEAHLSDVAREAAAIAREARLSTNLCEAIVRAAAWHDLGKAHQAFQARMGNGDGARGLLAKSMEYNRRAGRPYFRHELASALAFLQQHDGEPQADLVAFLIAAHHGKVRMGLRALPEERKPPNPATRFARGVWDGDTLPAVACGREQSAALELSLAPMQMGEDEAGRPSWAARMQALLGELGPFRLAYLEALVRMADWRASELEQADPDGI
jgi:CRISPR-associated endonuclease/helicase Cas3